MRGAKEAHALQERKPSTTPGWPRTSLLSRPIKTPRLMAQPQSETDAAAPTSPTLFLRRTEPPRADRECGQRPTRARR